MKLWMKILIGLFLGVIVGQVMPEFSVAIKPIGTLFINSIKMLIVPLIFSSLLVGIASMEDTKKMGRVGIKTFSLYLLTTAIAISIGLTIGTVMKPGQGVDLGNTTTIVKKTPQPF